MADSVAQVKDASVKIEEIQGQVMTSLESISSSTEENAAGTEEVSANSEEVMATMNWFNENISELEKNTGHFKIRSNFLNTLHFAGCFCYNGNILWNAEEKQWSKEENKTKALRP